MNDNDIASECQPRTVPQYGRGYLAFASYSKIIVRDVPLTSSLAQTDTERLWAQDAHHVMRLPLATIRTRVGLYFSRWVLG